MILFLSYSRKDQDAVDRLYTELSATGITVWYDRKSLLPGQDWRAEIRNSIRRADFVVPVLSINSVSSRGYFLNELAVAAETLNEIPEGQIYLVPVRLDDCSIPDKIAHRHCADLFPDWDDGFRILLRGLRHQIGTAAEQHDENQRLLEQLDHLIGSPKSFTDIERLTERLISPRTLQEKVDAMEEIGVRGFGDARIFFALEQEALADVSQLPRGQAIDDATYIRQAALWTIGLLNRPERMKSVPTSRLPGLDTITRVIRAPKENPDVKMAAVQALIVIERPDDPAVRSLLNIALRDRNPDVKAVARDALDRKTIGYRDKR